MNGVSISQYASLSGLAAAAGLLFVLSFVSPSSGRAEGRDAAARPRPPARGGACFVIEDFEDYQAGDTPSKWKRNKGRDLVPADRRVMSDSHEAVVKAEGGNKFVRMKMHNYAYRLIKLNGKHFPEWNTNRCPLLSWRWRVMDYPEGANEDDHDNNDVAAAVYVTFGRDWLGRPKSIKYTFSSTLPVGTTVDYGTLKVLVVASIEDGSPVRQWQRMRRDVVRDYKNLFGEAPDNDTPIGIQLFSDADVKSSRTAVADFDDVRVTKK